uniref:Uncharacterized protein n=2 Tax=Ditylum brightwellii TaxID=49249 RepID=A0A7S4SCG9_9STRA
MPSFQFQQAIRKAAIPTTGAAAVAVVTSSCAAYVAERGTTNATAHLSKKAISTAMSCRYASSLSSSAATAMRRNCGTQTSNRFLTNQIYSGRPFSTSATATTAGVKETITTTTTASKVSGGKGFVQWYESYLESSPIKTKMVTGGILWGMGDFVAQIVPVVFFPPENDETKNNKNTEEKHIEKTSPLSSFEYDYTRTARAVAFGFVIHAPASHVHFNFLEWMTVKAGVEGLKIPVFKAFMEQFVYWSWFSNSLYHGAMGGMQGMTPSEIYDRIADVLWETQKAQWVFWIPVQLLNFRFVPVRHQLNVVLVTSIVWTALLSAWYPPQNEEVGTKEDQTKRIEVKEK